MKMELLHICINPWRVRHELFSASVILMRDARKLESSVLNLVSYHLIRLSNKMIDSLQSNSTSMYIAHIVFIYEIRGIFDIIVL